MGVFQNNLMGAAAAAASAGGGDFYDYQIANSVRMSKSAGSTLKITAGTPTSSDTFTYSWWWKRYNVTDTATNSTLVFCAGTGGGTYVFFTFTNSSTMQANFNFTGGGYGDSRLTTDMLFRDTASWYHCVLRCDSTQSTASNRVRLYVNGVEPSYSSASVQTAVSQNEDFGFMNESGVVQSWGGISGVGTGSEGVDVQLADVILCDGQSYGADSFGEFKNGVWKPVDPSGLTFGNNGYYLKFESSSDLGNDSSGNNNDLTAANLSTHDQMLDTPTFNSDSNGGNFATMNPLISGSSSPALGEGNLMLDSFSGSDISGSLANFALPPSSGKWYFECFINSPNSGDNYPFIGLTATTYSQSATMGVSQRDLSINLGTGGSEKNETYVGSITTDFTGVSAYADNTVCGVFVDMDARKLWYAKDGVFTNSGNPQDGTNPNYTWTNNVPLLPHFVSFSSYGADSVLNFGQDGTFAGNVTAGGNSDVTGYGNFKYDPGDYKALCAGNLPIAEEIDPAQTDDDYPQKLFSPLIWTGDGTTSRAITGLGFQPDWLWFKSRSSAFSNRVYDTSRGIGSTGGKRLFSNTDGAETDQTSGQDISAVGTDGFTLGASSNLYTNDTNSGGLQVGWFWRANGGTTSSDASGDITSVGQVDPSGCFSIVTYTGSGTQNQTVAHHLSQAPIAALFKRRDGTKDWMFTAGTTYMNTRYMYLNDGAAAQSGLYNSGRTFSANAGSSLMTLEGATEMNGSGYSMLAYFFSNCEGYIKVGEYVGNANANGTFVYTGFKPAFVMVKYVGSGESWVMLDNKRDGYNPTNKNLRANNEYAESSGSTYDIDFLSNGFKPRTTWEGLNGSGYTIVYLAMAENPFKYATAR